MARFPESEPEIAALGALVVEGLGQAVEDFPTTPVPATELQAKLDAYSAARTATVVAETAFREQHVIKDEALDDLVDGLKANLKYAEIAVRDRVEGGKAGFYKIQRQSEDGPWEEGATSTNAEQLMSDQPRGVEVEFRVIAVNKAGEGQPSATATNVQTKRTHPGF